MNPAATAAFKLLGIVELNMPETSARKSRRSIMLHPPPSFSCHFERTRLPRSSFMQRREAALISLPITLDLLSWFAVSEEGSAERRPTNNGRDPELVGRDSVEPEDAPI